MKHLKRILILLTIILLTGCSSNKSNTSFKEIDNKEDSTNLQKGNNYLDNIDMSDVISISTSPSFAFNISNVNELRDFSDLVIIAEINSFEGASTSIATGSFNPMPDTYGELSVLEILKGDVSSDRLTFARAGGVLSVADYEKNAPLDMINRNAFRRDEADEEVDLENTYLKFSFKDDIEFEVGKTYLLFGMIIPSTNVFAITGIQYGTREIIFENNVNEMSKSSTDLGLMDNTNGTVVPLKNFIEEYFGN